MTRPFTPFAAIRAAHPIREGAHARSRIPSGDASRAPDLAGTTQEEGLTIYE